MFTWLCYWADMVKLHKEEIKSTPGVFKTWECFSLTVANFVIIFEHSRHPQLKLATQKLVGNLSELGTAQLWF